MQYKYNPVRNLLGSLVTIALTGRCNQKAGNQSVNDSDGTNLTQPGHPVPLINHPKAPSAAWQLVWEDSFDGSTMNRCHREGQQNCRSNRGGRNHGQKCYLCYKNIGYQSSGHKNAPVEGDPMDLDETLSFKPDNIRFIKY